MTTIRALPTKVLEVVADRDHCGRRYAVRETARAGETGLIRERDAWVVSDEDALDSLGNRTGAGIYSNPELLAIEGAIDAVPDVVPARLSVKHLNHIDYEVDDG